MSVAIIIPTLNESKNIGILLDRLSCLYPQAEIIVVDDGSTDGTIEIVKDYQKNVKLLEHYKTAETRGLTASILAGLRVVTTKFFVVIDGDLQHPPEVIRELIEALDRGATIAVGTRLPYRENQGWHRILATKCATFIAKKYLNYKGYQVRDPMSGFFAGLTEECLAVVNSNYKKFEMSGYKVLFEILKYSPRVMELQSINYQFQLRTGGKSKMQVRHAWSFLKSLLKS